MDEISGEDLMARLSGDGHRLAPSGALILGSTPRGHYILSVRYRLRSARSLISK
jgi:hypothetical protein